jgi:hypothetical protein
MKKLLITGSAIIGIFANVNASKFKIDESALNQLLSQSTEITVQELNSQFLSQSLEMKATFALPEKTRGGYLVRAFFCGGIALHRYYMGTNNKWLWALYFCVPVVGEVTACVDFWGAVFDADFYKKYENNDKYIVWLD